MNGRDPISDTELQTMQQRAEAASKGPWQSIIEGRDHFCGDNFIMVSLDDNEPDMYVARDRKPASHADLDFIAAARQDIPRLIAEIQRLRDQPHASKDPVVFYEPVLLDNETESIQYQAGAFPTEELAQQVLDVWRREGRKDQMAINVVTYYTTVEEWNENR